MLKHKWLNENGIETWQIERHEAALFHSDGDYEM
jgi:hypothetical protein